MLIALVCTSRCAVTNLSATVR